MATAALDIENPYEKGTPQYTIASTFLRGRKVTADKLRSQIEGNLSNRMVGSVIATLGESGLHIDRFKDPAEGMVYTPSKGAPIKQAVNGKAPKSAVKKMT